MNTKTDNPQAFPIVIAASEILAAEDTLRKVATNMATEYQPSWDRATMQKHVNSRAALIAARNVLLDIVESAARAQEEAK